MIGDEGPQMSAHNATTDLTLAIDCGNTNTRFCLLKDLAVVASWRRVTDDKRTADEDRVWLSQLMQLEGFELSRVRAVVIASVRPRSTFGLKQLSEVAFGLTPLVVGEGDVQLKVSPRMARPEQVGADRLVNARALEHSGEVPAIIVDFGTATTFDLIDAQGAYAGGVISPGVNVSIDALYAAAAKLPQVALVPDPPTLGEDTVSAMQSGIFWGYVGLIEGIISRLKNEHGQGLRVIATGGLATLFATATDAFDDIRDDLTILGLGLVERDHR